MSVTKSFKSLNLNSEFPQTNVGLRKIDRLSFNKVGRFESFLLRLDRRFKHEGIDLKNGEICLECKLWKLFLRTQQQRDNSELIAIQRWISQAKYIQAHDPQRQQKIKLKIKESCKPSDSALMAIGIAVNQHFPKLKQLELNFECIQSVTSEGFAFFSSKLFKNLTMLENLKLEFTKCYGIRNQALEVFGSDIGNNLINLCHMNLSFNETLWIADKDLLQFGSKLCRKLYKLKSITLSFIQCRGITERGAEMLKYFSHIMELEHAKFNFYKCRKMHDTQISKAGKKVTQLKLKKLSFKFSEYHLLDDLEIAFLGNQLGSYLRNLEELELSFLGEATENSQTKGFQSSLTTFFSKKKPEKSPKPLATRMQRLLSSLKRLTVSFINCTQISDHVIGSLGPDTLGYFQILEHLTFKFENCQNVSDKGVENITVQIATLLSNLKCLSLKFPGCQRVTDKQKVASQQILNYIPQLEIS